MILTNSDSAISNNIISNNTTATSTITASDTQQWTTNISYPQQWTVTDYTLTMPASNLVIKTLDIDEDKNQCAKQKPSKQEEKQKMFGVIKDDSILYSPYGPAIKNITGDYIAYDVEKDETICATGLTFANSRSMFYKIPTLVKDMELNDLIYINNHYCILCDIDEDNKNISVFDLYDSTTKTIRIPKSPYGFSFLTKIVCPFTHFSNENSQLLPLLFSETENVKDLLPLLFLKSKSEMDPLLLLLLSK